MLHAQCVVYVLFISVWIEMCLPLRWSARRLQSNKSKSEKFVAQYCVTADNIDVLPVVDSNFIHGEECSDRER
jgi:hypothetical protein